MSKKIVKVPAKKNIIVSKTPNKKSITKTPKMPQIQGKFREVFFQFYLSSWTESLFYHTKLYTLADCFPHRLNEHLAVIIKRNKKTIIESIKDQHILNTTDPEFQPYKDLIINFMNKSIKPGQYDITFVEFVTKNFTDLNKIHTILLNAWTGGTDYFNHLTADDLNTLDDFLARCCNDKKNIRHIDPKDFP